MTNTSNNPPRNQDEVANPPSFTFHAGDGRDQVDIPLSFSANPDLPGRINAITGPDGAGKSRIIADISRAARQTPDMRHARIDPQDTTFGNVVTISYTAMDHFDHRDTPPDYLNYGLIAKPPAGPPRLRDQKDLLDTLVDTIASATPDQAQAIDHHLNPLRNDTSIRLTGSRLTFTTQQDTQEQLKHLAPAHLIVITITVNLSLHLATGGLVLIDQPEAHLHPHLLAALMSTISQTIRERDAYAVVATNSPVVLQEIPAKQVHVMTQYGNTTRVQPPPIQTYGESIGLITSHVLNLDSNQSQYTETLKSLSERMSLEDIEQLFSHGLSSQARAIVMNLHRRYPA